MGFATTVVTEAVPLWFYGVSISGVSGVLIGAIVALYKRLLVVEDRRTSELRSHVEASKETAQALKDMADAIDRREG